MSEMIGIIDAELICNQCGQKIKMKHLKCQKEKREKLISEFVEDLKELVQGEMKEYGSYWFEIDDKIMKWEEKLK